MGSINTKNKVGDTTSMEVPITLMGYPAPDPPFFCLDDLRPPIPWYQDKVNENEFDWEGVEVDTGHSEDSGRFLTPATDTSSPRTPKSVLLNARRLMLSGRPGSLANHVRAGKVATKRWESTTSVGAMSLHSNYRREKPNQSSIISFDAIDVHARKASERHALSFEALVEYLKEPIRFHQYTDILLVRAIIIWLANQKIQKSFFVKAEISTPQGLLQSLATGKLSYAAVFTVLCREAGLQCALVEGVTKPFELKPEQDTIDILPDIWTCVYVEGEWQIVHPHLICKSLSGSVSSVDGRTHQEKNKTSQKRIENKQKIKQTVQHGINEDYFMPAPEVFVHSNFPKDTNWLLLPPEFIIPSIEAFTSLPFLFPAFFRLGLRMITEPNFTLHSREGKCRIWLITDYNNAHKLNFTYQLNLLRTDYKNTGILDENIHRQVVHCRHNDKFFFEISFPIEGDYKLEIHGGYHKRHTMRLCYFKLICDKRLSNFRYLPYNPGNIMWGPGPACVEHGLVLPSKPTGIVRMYEQIKSTVKEKRKLVRQLPEYKPKQFTFRLHTDTSQPKCFRYEAVLVGYPLTVTAEPASPFDGDGQLIDNTRKRQKHSSDVSPESYPDYTLCVKCEHREKKRQFIVSATIPHDGEFALVIRAAPAETNEGIENNTSADFTDVCVYLLRSVIGASKESVHQRLARNELQRSMTLKDGEYLQSCIDRCHKAKIDQHDDDIAAAHTRVEYLNHKKNMLDAMHRRNYRFVNFILSQVSSYRHKEALTVEIRRLFALRKQLKKLLEFKKYVSELQRAGNELATITNPPGEVHLTMGALLLLLDEPERYIESWEYIVHQLTSKDGYHCDAPIYKKMRLIAEMVPSKHRRRKILTLLSAYKYEQVRRTSKPAAKFYIWVQKVMDAYCEPELDEASDAKQLRVQSKQAVTYHTVKEFQDDSAHAQSVNEMDKKSND